MAIDYTYHSSNPNKKRSISPPSNQVISRKDSLALSKYTEQRNTSQTLYNAVTDRFADTKGWFLETWS